MASRFRLTDERRRLVEQFVRFRYLRIGHLYRLYRAGERVSERAVRRLVRDFWAMGYLQRRVARPCASQPAPAAEFAYWLSRKGLGLAEELGVGGEVLTPPRSTISRTLEHELAITDFHLAAEHALRARGIDLYWNQYGLRRGVNPDALFATIDRSQPDSASAAYHFLELERASLGGYAKGRSVLLRRLHRYAAYQGSAECQRDWRWFDEFRVVIVVRSEPRRKHLLEVLLAELPLPMFWVAVEGGAMTSAAFQSPADFRERSYSLSD